MMKKYEEHDAAGRVLCKRHKMIRCGDCEYIYELEQQNKRYKEAIEFGINYLKNSDIKQVQTVVTYLQSALAQSN